MWADVERARTRARRALDRCINAAVCTPEIILETPRPPARGRWPWGMGGGEARGCSSPAILQAGSGWRRGWASSRSEGDSAFS